MADDARELANTLFQRAIAPLVPERPEAKPLYHYTNAAGLRGIVESGALWASHAAYLNDASEGRDAFRIFQEACEPPFGGDRLTEVRGQLHAEIEDRHGLPESYVFSFTAHDDQLSQWRGYCPSGGYALGFDSEPLRQQVRDIGKQHGEIRFALGRCVYDPTAKTELAIGMVEDVLRWVEKEAGDDPPGERTRSIASDVFGMLAAGAAPLMKHERFSEEREWRIFSLINHDSLSPLHRERGALIVPYAALQPRDQNGRLPLVRVVVGPTAHVDIARAGVRSLLDAHGYGDVEVKDSAIPFRQL